MAHFHRGKSNERVVTDDRMMEGVMGTGDGTAWF